MESTINKIAKDFKAICDSNTELKVLAKKLKAGKATYLDADKYALELADSFEKALQINLGNGKITGAEYQEIIKQVMAKGMGTIYEEVAAYTQEIQQNLNKEMGLGLNAVKAEPNRSEIEAVTNKAAAANAYDDIPDGILQKLEHAAQNVATDTIDANAKSVENAGMEALVTRIYDGKGLHYGDYDCEWCISRCGTDVPYSQAKAKDMFRRHPGCGCIISYTVNGKTQVQTNWENNIWKEINTVRKQDNNVLLEWRKKSKPGIGKVSVEEGTKDSQEEQMALTLKNLFGGNIRVLAPEKQVGAKNPDYDWDGELWELKTCSTAKAPDTAIRSAFEQLYDASKRRKQPAGGVIIDLSGDDIDVAKAIETIQKRLVRWHGDNSIDLIVTRNGSEVITILRSK